MKITFPCHPRLLIINTIDSPITVSYPEQDQVISTFIVNARSDAFYKLC